MLSVKCAAADRTTGQFLIPSGNLTASEAPNHLQKQLTLETRRRRRIDVLNGYLNFATVFRGVRSVTAHFALLLFVCTLRRVGVCCQPNWPTDVLTPETGVERQGTFITRVPSARKCCSSGRTQLIVLLNVFYASIKHQHYHRFLKSDTFPERRIKTGRIGEVQNDDA